MSEEPFTPEVLAAVRAMALDLTPPPPMPERRYSFPSSKNDRLMRAVRMVLKATPVVPRPGVYFLVGQHGDVVYVGQSGNVARRLAGHGDKEYAEVRMIEIPDEDERLPWEAFFIQLLKPQFNKLSPEP